MTEHLMCRLGGTLCDDCFFERFGDMLTLDELRRSTLTRKWNRKLRDEYIAEYEAAGLDPDQDPGLVTIAAPAGSTVADVLDVVADASQIRRASPADFTERTTRCPR